MNLYVKMTLSMLTLLPFSLLLIGKKNMNYIGKIIYFGFGRFSFEELYY